MVLDVVQVKSFGSTWGPPGTERCARNPPYIVHTSSPGYINMTLSPSLCSEFQLATETPSTMVPSRHGTHCKHNSLVSPSVSRPAHIWMYVCWDVHQDTYRDIWVRRVIIIWCYQ